MLQAKLPNGKLLNLANLTREEINRYKRENQKFYCPSCEQFVIMKVGTKVIPHFAHHSNGICPSLEGGEGLYHEQGKHMLYAWLKSQKLDVKLEEYIPSIQQRPDILLTINKKKIAIEYQCARVEVSQIVKRNKGYQAVGITPIWILGATLFRRQGSNHFLLDAFSQQFIHRFSPKLPSVIYYFCPHTFQFITIQDIYYTKTIQAIGKLQIKKLNTISFKSLFTYKLYSKQELFHVWFKEKEKFRMLSRKKLYGKELTWQRWLYRKGTHIDFLPSIVFLPIPSQSYMKTPLWDWQSRICIEILSRLSIGSEFSIQSAISLLREEMQPTTYYPLIQWNGTPINQYFQLLTYVGILKMETTNMFIKVQDIPFYKNIHDAMEGDKELLEKLMTNKIQA